MYRKIKELLCACNLLWQPSLIAVVTTRLNAYPKALRLPGGVSDYKVFSY